MTPMRGTIDGNEAAAAVAYRLSEVIAIYPITPSSPMGEEADAWAATGKPNLFGTVPEVIEMQSEAGAAGALHGALSKGALGTTFTASQGLLLMLPNMFKIAGELTPAVIHVAARTIATHALSIFGDHSDVMTARTTGWAMLASSSVQEAHDFAAVSHAATLKARIPFLHFFDGFRTSHEVNKIDLIPDETLAALIDEELIAAHRLRGLDPDRPTLRGTAQNPDVFFQAREACNPFYDSVPAIVEDTFAAFAEQTGRNYGLVEYYGASDAERVIVMMGSGVGAVEETVDFLNSQGEKSGLVKIRLYRPFPVDRFIAALPASTKSIAVMDRTKEPGTIGEPLYQDVVTALAEAGGLGGLMPLVVGGRYGLSSKEFTPAMVKAVFDELEAATPKRHFTVGIFDDVTDMSLPPVELDTDHADVRAVFWGLGSDGTVSANKNSVKIIGENTDRNAQGYFVYDSKKSGSITVSHLRFDDNPIRSTYLIDNANFVACHQFGLLEKYDVLKTAEHGATFLLNSPYGPDEVWEHLPVEIQEQIMKKDLQFWVIDAHGIAAESGMRGRINTVMQTCFFALSGVLERDQAIAAIKESIEKTWAKRGKAIIEQNLAAVDHSIEGLYRVDVPTEISGDKHLRRPVPDGSPDFVERVTARIIAGDGDLLPVSALPADGTFPTGTARYEKRTIAHEIPIWDSSICIDCAKCAIVCPHAAIRMKVFDDSALAGAPETFDSKEFRSKDLPGMRMTIQVAPEDCTGCGVCVEVCPAKSKTEAKHKSINMSPIEEHIEVEKKNFDFFLSIPELDRTLIDGASLKGSQVREPLFEFSGACSGCGETPYLKLLTQLYGDRIIVANATGCSSIYGGNLPTTPWTVNDDGRGPAWSNSLFEDNAEFGLGMRLAHERQAEMARALLGDLRSEVGEELAAEILTNSPETQLTDAAVAQQRERVAELDAKLASILESGSGEAVLKASRLAGLTGALVRKSVWIVGGDGWAYDIGYGGLDHVLASGRDVNILVLDTEVYSNTGGQASKSTPRAAVAKFAASGKTTSKKDLGMIASQYGNVYVAQIAIGANDIQTIKALAEAEAWPGPSLIIAYSTCIAHGVDMEKSMARMREAVKSGYWPLYRYHPGSDEDTHPFRLDSKEPTISLREFTESEGRFAMLEHAAPERAGTLLDLAQADIDERWRLYSQLASVERSVPTPEEEE
ncbi:MAG: pyruvate:ferredoxin (flavodoxin) oxidoreductase [Acidobacteria bacterium]|nr:MAG: pyruvate:ferredoxin (flavodoxin) oxidoreductase [Acidobacteriota bacterium]